MKDFINKLLENKKVLIMIVIAIIVIIVFSILHSLIYNNDSSVVINNENSNEKWENIGSNSFAKKDGYIVINVVGEVNNPGVVTLEEGSRIIDQTTPNMIQRISEIFARNPLISSGL